MTRDYWRRREKRGELYDLTLWRGMLAIAVLLLLIGFLGFCAQLAHAQGTGNTHYASQYPGSDVATKVTAAQNDCTPGIPCVIVIGADLAPATSGTLPARCAQCVWYDYRTAQQIQVGQGAGNTLAQIGTGGGTPSGSTNYVQVNNAGAFGSDLNFQWDLVNHRLGVFANGAIDAPVKIGTNAAAGFVGLGPLFAMAYNVNDTNFPSVQFPMGMTDANDVSATNAGANNVIYGSWFSQFNAHGTGFSGVNGKVEPFVSQGKVSGNSTVTVWNDFSSAPTVDAGSTIGRRNAHTCSLHLGAGTVTTEVCFWDQNSAAAGYNIVQDGLGKNYLRGKLAVGFQGDPTDVLDIGGATGNLFFRGGKGQHIKTQAAGNDIAGTCTFAATTCTVTFTAAYTAAPACIANDQTAAAPVKSAPTTTNVVFTGGTGAGATDVIAYICIGNPN